MELSSIFLIVAALAAITDTATAAPVPLYTRALEQVNSFGRDLDVHRDRRDSGFAVLERNVDEPVDDIFTRSAAEHQFHHNQLAETARHAHNFAVYAAVTAEAASKVAETQLDARRWYLMSRNKHQTATDWKEVHKKHREAEASQEVTNLHQQVPVIFDAAHKSIQDSREIVKKANREHPNNTELEAAKHRLQLTHGWVQVHKS